MSPFPQFYLRSQAFEGSGKRLMGREILSWQLQAASLPLRWDGEGLRDEGMERWRDSQQVALRDEKTQSIVLRLQVAHWKHLHPGWSLSK